LDSLTGRHPFEVPTEYLRDHLDEMVDVTFRDLTSAFLLMPEGTGFIDFPDFRDAYEVLKRHTKSFEDFTEAFVIDAIRENSRVFGVLRSILGLTAPEWAELARSERGSDVDQNYARGLDRDFRADAGLYSRVEREYFTRLKKSPGKFSPPVSLTRIAALVSVAIEYLSRGAPAETTGMIHRLAKFDTQEGVASLQYAARESIPYPVLLYERYLGRPFATHRDAISELVGEVMENAIEDRLRSSGITYRKTKRAERIPGFGQAPDFCVPDEVAPAVVIEAKITSDDGTARDKATRIIRLATQRDDHVSAGHTSHYEVVACIDGRGFRQRREDMKQMLIALDGKLFTTATLDHLFAHTRLREFVTRGRTLDETPG
jgi:hypothetical protein